MTLRARMRTAPASVYKVARSLVACSHWMGCGMLARSAAAERLYLPKPSAGSPVSSMLNADS